MKEHETPQSLQVLFAGQPIPGAVFVRGEEGSEFKGVRPPRGQSYLYTKGRHLCLQILCRLDAPEFRATLNAVGELLVAGPSALVGFGSAADVEVGRTKTRPAPSTDRRVLNWDRATFFGCRHEMFEGKPHRRYTFIAIAVAGASPEKKK